MVRSGGDRRQPRQGRQVRLYYIHAGLVCILKIEKEEQLVSLNRSSDPEPGLAASEEGVRIKRVPIQAGIGRDVVIAEIEICGAVEVVRTDRKSTRLNSSH